MQYQLINAWTTFFSVWSVFSSAVLAQSKALFTASRLAFPPSLKSTKRAGRCRWAGVELLRMPADRSERRSLRGARHLHAAKQPLECWPRIASTEISLSGFLYIYLPFLLIYALVSTLKSLAIKVFITTDLLLTNASWSVRLAQNHTNTIFLLW